jgi:2-dehydropantoate 2-reductase
LAALLAAAGPQRDAAYMTLSTADGSFSASVPMAIVAERGIVVYGLNGAPLPEAKGGPVRFYIQDVDSCGVADLDKCANVKHLARIELSKTPGRDHRPKTKKAHEALHEAEGGR